jgi:predicted transcriptional regulator
MTEGILDKWNQDELVLLPVIKVDEAKEIISEFDSVFSAFETGERLELIKGLTKGLLNNPDSGRGWAKLLIYTKALISEGRLFTDNMEPVPENSDPGTILRKWREGKLNWLPPEK